MDKQKLVYDLNIDISHITTALNKANNVDETSLHDDVSALINKVLPDFITINKELRTHSTSLATNTLKSAKANINNIKFLNTLAKVHGAFRLLESALKQSKGRYLSPYPYSFLRILWNNDLDCLRLIKIEKPKNYAEEQFNATL